MTFDDLDYEELTKTLTDNFNVLADEVQLLSDRKTILEHKLRFAHEQYQRLADKYAHGDAEISSTLAKLQLPPDLQVSAPERTGFVPLPLRGQAQSKHQTAVAIRDGRRAAQRIAALVGRSTGSTASRRSISGASSSMRLSARRTSLSTVLEQDFTVPGKKSSLLCPFSKPSNAMSAVMNPRESQGSDTQDSDRPLTPSDIKDPTPHQSSDPICAAMYAETMPSAPPSVTGSAAKCPIRYLDQHSPEEVARYFETHKHEIPRSHEICVRHYQRNEDDIRKLDAKYGNLVSMIQGLGQKHKPMLPLNGEEIDEENEELERTSNKRVESWAKAVSADGVEIEAGVSPEHEEEDRQERFDRPLKEIRVGESPSRPWGISVPIFDPPNYRRPASPPPAPVSVEHIPKTLGHGQQDIVEAQSTPVQVQERPVGKCSLGHDQAANFDQMPAPHGNAERPVGKCPFGHGKAAAEKKPAQPSMIERPTGKCPFSHNAQTKEQGPAPRAQPPLAIQAQPTFIQPTEAQKMGPQMIFTGPVFIGYPIEQAMAFMQQYKGTQ